MDKKAIALNGTAAKSLDDEWSRMNAALAELGPAKSRTALAHAEGRLIFALDLTGSRGAGLIQARIATAQMFATIRKIGTVAVKMIYYRGLNECRASTWHDDAGALTGAMKKLSCESGATQIARLLRLALAEKEKLSGVVFIGDHCEENPDELTGLALALGKRSIPLFVFHECADNNEPSLQAKPVFKLMAEASGGIYQEFRPDSDAALRELLSTVAAFSAAGHDGIKQVAPPVTAAARQLQSSLLLLTAAKGK